MTGAEKVAQTLKALSEPDEDAGAMELTLASVAMGLERNQASGELDQFVLALTRWIGWHRSDGRRLVVVELPVTQPEGIRALPAGTKLHALDEAIAASENPTNPL